MENTVHLEHESQHVSTEVLRPKPISKLHQTLASIDDDMLFRDRPDLAPLVNWSSGRNAPFNRWIRYREAYSPELVDALQLRGRILDPFCGSGSLLIGAAQRGLSAVGVDLNPLATFAARVKLAKLSRLELSTISQFLKTVTIDALSTVAAPSMPSLSISRKVFEPDILETILRLREFITISGLNTRCMDFVRLGWLAILERVGSYFKEGNGIKYRRMVRRPGKYLARTDGAWQEARFGLNQTEHVVREFRAHIEVMLSDTKLWRAMSGDCRVVTGNALSLGDLVDGQFDSIVFSPPYANRFDYFESMKVELWFGEFVDSYTDVSQLRKASIRSHLGADMSRSLVAFPALEKLISQMDSSASSWRMGVPNLLRGYFSDMVSVLTACRERLTNGACYVIVGNSAFANVIVPTDSLTVHAAREAGFGGSEIWTTRHLTVSPQQRSSLKGLEQYMRESVVVIRP